MPATTGRLTAWDFIEHSIVALDPQPDSLNYRASMSAGDKTIRQSDPHGRPKGDLSSEIARAVFENNLEAIYSAMLKALKKGNPGVFAVLADRAYGKAKQQVEVDDSNDRIVEMLETDFSVGSRS